MIVESIRAIILFLLSLYFVRAQDDSATTDPSQTFKFKEKYPAPHKIPTAKPEWLDLIRHANITKAPVYKNINYAGKKTR